MEFIKEISWKGRHVSLNDWYGGGHWSKRKKMADSWHLFFMHLLGRLAPLKTYKLKMYYNSNFDADNCICMIKFLSDSMVKKKIVEDDNKKFCRGISIEPDETLAKNEYKILIFGEKKTNENNQ